MSLIDFANGGVDTLNALAPMHDTVDLVAKDLDAPKVDWSPTAGMKEACRKAAFFLAALWLFWVLLQFALPKKRQMMAGGQMGAGRFVGAAALIVILLDLDLVPTIINWVLEGIWWVADLVGIVAQPLAVQLSAVTPVVSSAMGLAA